MEKNTRVIELENALQALVNKLDLVSIEITQLTVLAWVHGNRYTGPTYGKELEHAKEVLNK